MVKVLPLKGYRSLRALNAFHTLMLGLKMLPLYMGVSYEEFFESFKDKSDEEKEAAIRQAAIFVRLEKDEVEDLLAFVADKNGIPFSSENMKSMNPEVFFESIVAVCMQIARIKVDLISESEKKKSQSSVLISETASSGILN